MKAKAIFLFLLLTAVNFSLQVFLGWHMALSLVVAGVITLAVNVAWPSKETDHEETNDR